MNGMIKPNKVLQYVCNLPLVCQLYAYEAIQLNIIKTRITLEKSRVSSFLKYGGA
jgi:hypothetical protein